MSASAAAVVTRRCCEKRPAGTGWRSAAAQGYAQRKDTPTTTAALRLQWTTSSAEIATRSSEISRTVPRRRRSFPVPAAAAAALDDELLPAVFGRSALTDT